MTHKLDHMHLMRLFVAINQHGSFASAAAHLNITATKASKDIRYLEESLETNLLHRTTRSLQLTDSGEVFFNKALEILELHGQLLDSINTMKTSLSGELRITAPELWGKIELLPLILAFKQIYPEVAFIAHFSNEPSDLNRDNFHIAFRSTELKNEPYLARHISRDESVLCASEHYLEVSPGVASPQDLDTQQMITLAQHNTHHDQISFIYHGQRLTQHVTGSLCFSNKEAIFETVKAGHGIAVLPKYLVQADITAGRLVEVLPDYQLESADFYALYTQKRKESALVNTFIDYVCQEKGCSD